MNDNSERITRFSDFPFSGLLELKQTMDKDYAELLFALKKEEKNLKKEIQNALKMESDFYTAHQLQRGLSLLQSRMRSLEKISDPLFEKKRLRVPH